VPQSEGPAWFADRLVERESPTAQSLSHATINPYMSAKIRTAIESVAIAIIDWLVGKSDEKSSA
jgi:hypothetical protein